MEKIIYIEWNDSNVELGQVSKDEKFERAFMQTVGFIIAEDPAQITLAREIVDVTDCRGVITIPKENITMRSDVSLSE